MSFIDAKNISIVFEKKRVITNFTYSFPAGCYALVGPNGCGKSSLLKVLAGINLNFQGKLTIHEKTRYNEQRTFLPDIPKFYPFIKAKEFISMVCRVRGIDTQKYMLRFGEVFKIHEFFHQPINSLSLGQTKRLFCMVTLIDEAPIWILDEPSNGLDTFSKEMLIECIKNHSKGNLVVFSEHNRDVIEKIGSTVTQASGTPLK